MSPALKQCHYDNHISGSPADLGPKTCSDRCRRINGWQRYSERAASVSSFAPYTHGATVKFYQTAHQRESNPHAAGYAINTSPLNEEVEYTWDKIVRYADPRVFHF